jgi:hypothetical protein
MPTTPLSPERLAQALAQAIREVTAAEIDKLARTLAEPRDSSVELRGSRGTVLTNPCRPRSCTENAPSPVAKLPRSPRLSGPGRRTNRPFTP